MNIHSANIKFLLCARLERRAVTRSPRDAETNSPNALILCTAFAPGLFCVSVHYSKPGFGFYER